MNTDAKEKYYVLYTPTGQQSKVRKVLTVTLPEGRGLIFYPCMESYRRGRTEPEIVALFPGYIFIRTTMSFFEVHEYMRTSRHELAVYVRELGLGERVLSGDIEADDSLVSDMDEGECEFLDFLLGIGQPEGPAMDGLLRMSSGYREGKRYVVMQGPLKYYEDRIVDVNMHDRKAYLDFKIKNCTVKAGFEIKPKKYWFPDGTEQTTLEDGTEIDIKKLKRSMEAKL